MSKKTRPETEFEEDDEVTEISQTKRPAEANDLESSIEKVESDISDLVTTLEKERDEFKDKFLRTYADLENFRKRVSKEKEELLKFGNEKLLKEILFIKDNLDRALNHKDDADPKSLIEGLELIHREFDKLMGQVNVEEVETIGKPFDPEKHEALAEEESQQAPGTILAEYQKGYIYHGRLLRPARVVVAKAPGTTPNKES